MNNEIIKVISADLFAIMHILTAPPAKDDSEAEWKRLEELDSAWNELQNKYSKEMLGDIEDGLNCVVDTYTEKLLDGDYGDE
jgi:hypothetical protein